MGNSLLTYLNKRTEEDYSKKMVKTKIAGPVITISREVGCNGSILATLITERLNKRKTVSDWKVLSKEVFHQSAKELNMEPEHVRKIFKKSDKYAFDEILKAFSDKNFKSERKIVKTVADIILSFAVDGFCIIVGRAGHIIAKDIKNALHIRLVAPLNYRINTIMNNNQLNRNDAIAFIKQVEKERIIFRKTIREDNLQEVLFDLTLNRASFTDDEVVDIIELAMDKKGILKDPEPKIQYY
jgi:cytidylate kinase